MSQGEYISAEYLEGIYRQHDLVKQIFVHGDSLKDYLVAVVIPEKDFVIKMAEGQPFEGLDYDAMIQHESFTQLMLDILKGKKIRNESRK